MPIHRVILLPLEVQNVPKTAAYRVTHVSASYIDDLHLQGRTYDFCGSNVIDTFLQFDSLGFTIYPGKSVFIPSQRLVLLGVIIDSVAMTITLTPEKAFKLKEACGTLLGQRPSHNTTSNNFIIELLSTPKP